MLMYYHLSNPRGGILARNTAFTLRTFSKRANYGQRLTFKSKNDARTWTTRQTLYCHQNLASFRQFSASSLFRSASKQVNMRSATKNAKKKREQALWKILATMVKIVRIPVVVYSVYALGHQQGMIDYAHNPDAKKKEILHSILQGA